MNLPKYYSARAYAKLTGLGEAEVKKMIDRGFLKGNKTEGGQYKIEVWENSIPIEQYEELLKQKLELEAKVNSVKAVLN